MKRFDRAMGSTLVAEPPEDPATMFWRWADDYLNIANAYEERGYRVAEGLPEKAGEAWSMVWRLDARGSTVAADLHDPGGREWRYDKSEAGGVDLSDFRFLDQAD